MAAHAGQFAIFYTSGFPVKILEQVLEWLVLITNTLDKFSNNKIRINVEFNLTIFNVYSWGMHSFKVLLCYFLMSLYLQESPVLWHESLFKRKPTEEYKEIRERIFERKSAKNIRKKIRERIFVRKSATAHSKKNPRKNILKKKGKGIKAFISFKIIRKQIFERKSAKEYSKENEWKNVWNKIQMYESSYRHKSVLQWILTPTLTR